jgi:hypothetical protein
LELIYSLKLSVMKNSIVTATNRFIMLITIMLMSVVAFAQEKGVDINVDVNKSGGWYANPWVWIVGAAVFILLLVAIVRGGSRTSD